MSKSRTINFEHVHSFSRQLKMYRGWGNQDKKEGGFKNIMSSVRKHFSTDLNVKTVHDILKEEKSVTQLSSEYQVHYSQLLK